MARKTLNRRELRKEAESAEQSTVKKKKKAATTDDGAEKKKKTKTKRKSRAKSAKEVRLKAMWGVFTQSMRKITAFEYTERKQAQTKAEDLTASQKSPHFVQLIKEEIQDEQ